MHKSQLRKPDGRRLLLYGRAPIAGDILAPSPLSAAERGAIRTHLRWHPLRGEWVAYASHRQGRTFLPDWNPLAPTTDPARPTELPDGAYDIAVFENLFPALAPSALARDQSAVPHRGGAGTAEVVVFTRDAGSSLGALPLDHLDLLFEVWADRTRELGARGDVDYVFPFENRGVEVGVTLHHPHGQIYGYPFVPPVAARELELQRQHRARHGRGLLADLIAAEIADGRRLLYGGDEVVAFVPACARYAYEIWIAPRREVASLVDLAPAERADFARALKTVLLKLDRLWSRPMPYLLQFHQAPTDGAPHPEAHLHIEIYPAYRLPGRLKYLACTEVGAGVFTADTLPEEKAAELRAIDVEVG
jgi:UDPglucose--hexose-1-phosphate uridylyltransferase